MKHTLLPKRLQAQLMAAAATESLAEIDAVIKDVRQQAPFNFHPDKSLDSRVFFDEPAGLYSGTFIKAAPRTFTRKKDAAQ